MTDASAKGRAARTRRPGEIADKSKRGRASKRKGKAFERTLQQKFRAFLPNDYQVYHSGMLQGRGGLSTPDVGVYQFGRNIVHGEAKHQKRPNIAAAYEQAKADSALSQAMPVAITHKTGRTNPTLVTMELEYFLELLLAWLELNK